MHFNLTLKCCNQALQTEEKNTVTVIQYTVAHEICASTVDEPKVPTDDASFTIVLGKFIRSGIK